MILFLIIAWVFGVRFLERETRTYPNIQTFSLGADWDKPMYYEGPIKQLYKDGVLVAELDRIEITWGTLK